MKIFDWRNYDKYMGHFGSHYNLENRLDNIPDTSKLHIHFLGSWGFCVFGGVWGTIFRGLN